MKRAEDWWAEVTCRHQRALTIDRAYNWSAARLLIKSAGRRFNPGLDRWCPDCGAVRLWLRETRPSWIRPGEDASVLTGKRREKS